jgi:hypothetical protein
MKSRQQILLSAFLCQWAFFSFILIHAIFNAMFFRFAGGFSFLAQTYALVYHMRRKDPKR